MLTLLFNGILWCSFHCHITGIRHIKYITWQDILSLNLYYHYIIVIHWRSFPTNYNEFKPQNVSLFIQALCLSCLHQSPLCFTSIPANFTFPLHRKAQRRGVAAVAVAWVWCASWQAAAKRKASLLPLHTPWTTLCLRTPLSPPQVSSSTSTQGRLERFSIVTQEPSDSTFFLHTFPCLCPSSSLTQTLNIKGWRKENLKNCRIYRLRPVLFVSLSLQDVKWLVYHLFPFP